MINEKTLFGWLIFTIAWPPVKVVVNISFLVFVLIILLKYYNNKFRVVKLDLIDLFSVLFLLSIFLSNIFTSNTTINALSSLHINHVYWLVLFMYLRRIPRDWFSTISKNVFFGIVVLSLTYWIPLPKLNSFVIFPVIRERNVYTYQLVLLVPFALEFLRTYNKKVFFSLVFLLLAILTDGRTGALLVLLGIIPVVINSRLRIVALGSIIFFGASLSTLKVAETLAPRLVSTISSASLSDDTSWLYRRAMVEKGLLMFEEHPFFGTGLGSWRSYNVDVSEMLRKDVFDRVRGKATDWNRISPHNSYVQILAEQGLIGCGIWLILLILILRESFIKLRKKQLWIMGFLSMLIYLYVISSYQSAVTFLLLGLASNKEL